MADPRLLSTQAPQGPGRGGPLAESVSHLPDINQYGPDAELIAGPMQQWASAFEYQNRRPPTPQEAERHKLLLISQGYSQMPDGSIRDVNAFNAKQRIDKATKLYNRLDEEYQDFEDSTFYKVGDAMSDAARVVLSPLIFLKKLGGEDTTNLLDPSARVRAGYSGSLSALQELAANNYNMVQDSAKLRDAERLARVKSDADIDKTVAETQEKHLKNRYGEENLKVIRHAGSAGVDAAPLVGTPEFETLREDYRIANNQGIRFNGTYRSKEVMESVDTYAKEYRTETKAIREVMPRVQSLIGLLDQDGGISDFLSVINTLKIAEPTSAVLAGEQAAIRAAIGVLDQFKGRVKNIAGSGDFTEDTRNKLKEAAMELFSSYSGLQDKEYRLATKRLTALGMREDDINILLDDKIDLNPGQEEMTNNLPTPGARDPNDATTW